MARRIRNAITTMQGFIETICGPDTFGGEDANELQGALAQSAKVWGDNGASLDDPLVRQSARFFTRIMQGFMPGIPGDQEQIPLKPGARRDMIMQSVGTEDFPEIFGTIIHRRLLGMFEVSPPAARRLCQHAVRSDFRTNKMYYITGGTDELQLVEKRGIPRQSDKLASANFSYFMEVYAKNLSVNWRDLVDDAGDLKIFDSIAKMLFTSARKTEELFILRNFFVNDAKTGWNSDAPGSDGIYGPFTTTQYGAAAQTNALSLSAIETNAGLMRLFNTPDGEPMQVMPDILVVNRALAITARNLLAAKQVRRDSGSVGLYSTDSPILQLGLDIVVLDWLDYAANGSGTKAAGMWGLFANPNNPMVPTGVAEFATFSGFETPQLYYKDSNRRSVSGAPVQNLGDFDDMEHTWQVVYPMGGCTLFGNTAIVSNGS